MKYKIILSILVLTCIGLSFFCGTQYGYYKANIQYEKNIVILDDAYKNIVVDIRKAHKDSVKKLKEYYYNKLKDVDTACPKENITFFDHELIAFWAEMYNKYNFIYIPKGVFNNPATHFTEEDVDRLDGALNKLKERK